RYRDDADSAGDHVDPADRVAPLHGEPDAAAPIESEGVRVAGVDAGSLGHRVGSELAAAGVEFQDRAVAVAGNPREAIAVHHHGVRLGAGGQVVAVEGLGFRIEHCQVVAQLADEPDASIGGDGGVAWPGIGPGDLPFPDLD